MRRCWSQDPLQRPTFTVIRDDLEEIMCQEGTYFPFDCDEASIRSDHEENGVNAGVIADRPTVKAGVHCEFSELTYVEESTKETSF